jgi:hypothetical protein
MKRFFPIVLLFLLSACGSGGPPLPDWKSDSADLIERYKKSALLGENTLAERYFQQAIRATGGAGRVSETARLWLVHCATRRASLVDDDCHEYADLARLETSAEDHAYYQFVTLNWSALDASKLPAHYAALLKTDAPRINAQIAAIEDPLSRLLATSLTTLRGQADTVTLSLAAETASSQGWRLPLLTYLKLLEKNAITRGALIEQQAYALRIRLIEDALRAPNAKPAGDPIK